MSDFFRNYRSNYYNMDKIKPIRGTLATNIMSRVNMNKGIFKHVASYYPYRIEDFERPDTVSTKYYGSPDYVWLILLANEIHDPIYDWPLFGEQLQFYIEDAYGTIENAKAGVHHYEQILRHAVPKSADNARVLEKVAIVDKETYDTLADGNRRTINNYDHVIKENNKKKNIILVENTYAKECLNELRGVYQS